MKTIKEKFEDRFKVVELPKRGVWIWDKEEQYNVAVEAASLEEALMHALLQAVTYRYKYRDQLRKLESSVSAFVETLDHDLLPDFIDNDCL